MCLCHKQWEPVLLRAGNSGGIDDTLFQCISDNLWGERRGSGKGASLDFERDTDTENFIPFFILKGNGRRRKNKLLMGTSSR